jgi:hypothetical protein
LLPMSSVHTPEASHITASQLAAELPDYHRLSRLALSKLRLCPEILTLHRSPRPLNSQP